MPTTNFAINHFTCTPLAQQVLAKIASGSQTDIELSEDERLLLILTCQYHSDTSEQKQLIQEAFQELYERVDLTRLVILKLLNFEGQRQARETTGLIEKLTQRGVTTSADMRHERRPQPALRSISDDITSSQADFVLDFQAADGLNPESPSAGVSHHSDPLNSTKPHPPSKVEVNGIDISTAVNTDTDVDPILHYIANLPQ